MCSTSREKGALQQLRRVAAMWIMTSVHLPARDGSCTNLADKLKRIGGVTACAERCSGIFKPQCADFTVRQMTGAAFCLSLQVHASICLCSL